MAYHLYNEPEPKEACPYCQSEMIADWVDVGIAMQQCGPYHCFNCGASEIGPEKANPGFKDTVTEEELNTGFYKAKISPLANVIDGVPVNHHVAEKVYKAGLGRILRQENQS
jgi:hypothetical protein